MKITPSLGLAVLIFAAGGGSAPAAEDGGFWSHQLYLVVVAEQPRPDSPFVPPTAEHPAYCATYDGGYVEQGDPVANERPPAPPVVAQALFRSLAAEHYLPATDRAPPSVLLIYHWGVLNQDTFEIHSDLRLGSNERARLGLVAPAAIAHRIQQDLLDERTAREAHSRVWFPYFLDFRERDILDLARDDRYFVIVSAYDYAAVAHHEARLLWRVKISTRSAGAAMASALPALLRRGASYFGQNLAEPQYVTTPEVPPGRVEVGVPQLEEYLPPPAVARELKDPFVRRIAGREHRQFSGVRGPWPHHARSADPPVHAAPAGS